jgi:hypothetical protein
MTYIVVADYLDEINDSAGEWPNGLPKEVYEHHAGDEITLENAGEDRIQVYLAAGAVKQKDEAAPEGDGETTPEGEQQKRLAAGELPAEVKSTEVVTEDGAEADDATGATGAADGPTGTASSTSGTSSKGSTGASGGGEAPAST